MMAVKREENPAGSSNSLRGDVLRVLGVLKVATVEQIEQISAPHLSYRHTDKPTPSKRKQARTASHTGALSDLRKHGLAEKGGQLPGGDTLRNLTPMGLKAAARELGRPVGEMGNPARGAGRTGASHLGAALAQWYEEMHERQRTAHLSRRILVEHGISYLKNWRSLARHHGRREHMSDIIHAVAGLLSRQQATTTASGTRT
ncbi:hypothetical protein ABZ454_35715 [Streptomyces sp. NPDC005803]|uniref:hypothetical protein n=1 Tax=Streptomyces sp. NPDC005803 TaxID=3154297 RepID=UPI0033FAE1E2